MLRVTLPGIVALALLLIGASSASSAATAHWTLLGWNDLGLHCMDGDYSVFSLAPPYNNLRAQVIDPNGLLVNDPARVRLSYEAVADPDGSINRTSIGKTGFWSNVQSLFGAPLAPDFGLAGCNMPGAANTAQPLAFDSARRWFGADGVPITPYDDNGNKNTYPLMRLVARDANGAQLAEASVVLPVSDQMDCSTCHRSNSVALARPAAGWVRDANPARDFRLNILRLHDDRQRGVPAYASALAQLGLNPEGLYPSALSNNRPVRCAACHASNAPSGSAGIAGIAPLTRAMHSFHATVHDPISGMTLDSSDNRAACFSCHPGSSTTRPRGVMGNATAADGSIAMQCQSCHGNMSAVGDANRSGWLQQPSCQNCHSGTATLNSGSIRFTTAFDGNGGLRQAADQTYATTPNQPAAGFNLYRSSTGHGGLYCEACHGSTHAEFPSAQRNDNLQSQQLQGHAGVVAECTACHATAPNGLGGPHSMHPLGTPWVAQHRSFAQNGGATCKPCHGSDSRGSELSASQSDQTVNSALGNKTFWRGFRISCYACHEGPSTASATRNHPPTVVDATLTAAFASSTSVDLAASDADGNPLTLRIVSQPAHGSVTLADRRATFLPEPGFVGDDEFTFAAFDGKTESNLGHVRAHVNAAAYQIGADSSGAFFDPAQSGQGWFVEALGNHGVVAGWYVYLNGEQRWLFGNGTASGNQVRISMVIGSGGQFPPNYNVATTNLETWGEVVLLFADKDHATATWTSGYAGFGNGQMPLTRLTALAPADGLSPIGKITACHTGSWYNANQSGHGLQVEVLDREPREMVAIWYTYLNGQPRWLYAQGPIVGDTATLDTLITQGGQFPPNFNPANVVRQSWGTLRFRAIDGNRAHIDWTSTVSGYGSGGLDLVRLTSTAGRDCP